jgi:hypothetical protein
VSDSGPSGSPPVDSGGALDHSRGMRAEPPRQATIGCSLVPPVEAPKVTMIIARFVGAESVRETCAVPQTFGEMRILTSSSRDFSVNAPVVAARSSTIIRLQATTEPEGAPVIWTIEGGGAAPTLAPDGASARLFTNGTGGFSVVATVGATSCCFNIILVAVTLRSTRVLRSCANFATERPEEGQVGAASGAFDLDHPGRSAMWTEVIADLDAGGHPVLGKIHVGIVNNMREVTTLARYGDGVEPLEQHIVHRDLETGDRTRLEGPILDCPGVNAHAGRDVGGGSIFLSHCRETPSHGGRRRTVIACDSPGVFFPEVHAGRTITAIEGRCVFRMFIAVYSTDLPFCYAIYGHADWSVLFDGAMDSRLGRPRWVSGGRTDRVPGDQTFTLFAGGNEASVVNAEVRPPTAAQFLSIRPAGDVDRRVARVRILDNGALRGDGALTQIVNLPRRPAFQPEATRPERLGRTLDVEVELEGSPPFTFTFGVAVTPGDERVYSDAEREHDVYQLKIGGTEATRREYTINEQRKRIRVHLPAAGAKRYQCLAWVGAGTEESRRLAPRVTAERVIYCQTLVRGPQSPGNCMPALQDFFTRHATGIRLVNLNLNQGDCDPIGAFNAWDLDSVRAALGQPHVYRGATRQPHVIAILFVDEMPMRGDTAVIDAPPGPISVAAAAPDVVFQSTQRIWNQNVGTNEETRPWLQDATFTVGDVEYDVSTYVSRVAHPPGSTRMIRLRFEAARFFTAVLASSGARSVTGTLSIAYFPIRQFLQGGWVRNTNLIVMPVIGPRGMTTAEALIATLGHEIGHAIGMVPGGAVATGLDRGPNQYDNNGSHCRFTSVGAFTCAMYEEDQNRPDLCASCRDAFGRVDLSRGF